ncbi:MAG: MFS transporter [Dehalococcoidia bacterium]|nr:MFS transporter [Dehalococcoidia bacterium]
MVELKDPEPQPAEPPQLGRLARFRASPLGETIGIRSFRFYWTASFFYFIAFGAQRFTFVWLVLELSDNEALAGLTAFALGIPAFFITLPAGAYADRLDRRRMFMVSNALGGLVSLGAAVLIWTDVMSVPLAIATAIAMGIATAATQPPLTAIVPTIVPRDRLMNGIVLRTMGQNLGMILGVAVGGMTIQLWDLGGAFAVLGIAFFLGILSMMGVRIPPMPTIDGPRPALWEQVREGLAFIYHHDGLRNLIILMGIVGFFMLGPIFVLMPVIARDDLGQNAFWSAQLFTFTSIGMLGMSIALASIGGLNQKGKWMLGSLIMGGANLILLGWSPWYPMTAFLMFIWGLGGGIQINLNQTLAQSNTPDHMMGRVMSVVMLSIAGLMPLGSLIAGWGAGRFGSGEWLIGCGVLLILLGIVSWTRLPALREMD